MSTYMTNIPDTISFAKIIADETRQKIMKLTCCRWRTVTEIVEQLNVTQPTVSHHLAVLREAGLVDFKEDGKLTYYQLNRDLVTVCCGNLVTKFSSEEPTNTCCNGETK
jgi:ArsR family transcriptional regulator, arsenate/arsenite/antimonite-responsive transcriptional repressor